MIQSAAHILRVLLVDDHPDVAYLVSEKLMQRFFCVIEHAISAQDGSTKAKIENFDVIIWGLTNWEEGAQLYCEVLFAQKTPPKFIMFLNDPSVLKPDFDKYFPSVRRDNYDELVKTIGRLGFRWNRPE